MNPGIKTSSQIYFMVRENKQNNDGELQKPPVIWSKKVCPLAKSRETC